MGVVSEAIGKAGSQENHHDASNGEEGEHNELGRVFLLFLMGQELEFAFLEEEEEEEDRLVLKGLRPL